MSEPLSTEYFTFAQSEPGPSSPILDLNTRNHPYTQEFRPVICSPDSHEDGDIEVVCISPTPVHTSSSREKIEKSIATIESAAVGAFSCDFDNTGAGCKNQRNDYAAERAFGSPQEQIQGINKIGPKKLDEGKHMKVCSPIIRPPGTPTLGESVRYGVESVFWISYQSSVLGILPLLIITIVYGSAMFFDIKKSTIVPYFSFINSFFVLVFYAMISFIFLFLFGKERVLKHVFRATIPIAILHSVANTARVIYGLRYLSPIYYGLTLINYIYISWKVKSYSVKENDRSPNLTQEEKRYVTLSSDGTPMALFKGFIPYMLFYYATANFILPQLMTSNLLRRLIGRIIIIPFLANVADSYQNGLMVLRSNEYMKYRVILGSIYNSISLTILRVMTTSPSNLEDTAIMTLTASVSEVILRTSFIARSAYLTYIIRLLKYHFHTHSCMKKKIENVNKDSKKMPVTNGPNHNLSMVSDSVEEQLSVEEFLQDKVRELSELDFSLQGFTEFCKIMNNNDTIYGHIANYHLTRTYYMEMFEIQSAVFIPLILYLSNPIKEYSTFQTFNSFFDVLTNISLQLAVELITQSICNSLELYIYIYIYGKTLPVQKSWNFYMRPIVIIQFGLNILSVIHLSTSSFRLSAESWPDEQ